jgi:hypothetical protein
MVPEKQNPKHEFRQQEPEKIQRKTESKPARKSDSERVIKQQEPEKRSKK